MLVFFASEHQLSRKLYHAFFRKRLQKDYFDKKNSGKPTKLSLYTSKKYLAEI